MFEKERAEIRVLANIADAQWMGRARDFLLAAEAEFAFRDKRLAEQQEALAAMYSNAEAVA